MDNEKKNDQQKRHFHHRRRHHRRRNEKIAPQTQVNTAEEVANSEAIEKSEEIEKEKEKIASPIIPIEQMKTVLIPESAIAESVSNDDETPQAEEVKKHLVVGVRFRPAGKNYSFAPGALTLMVGDQVIVETSQGQEFGTVSTANRMISEKELVLPLRNILRRASDADKKRFEENKELELRGRKVFLEKTQEHQLDMALSDVECSFDRSKLVFYFTSEGRVDFREFVKDMASVFKTRIELRQIGVRDEAKQLGGLGICGRPLCCSSFLEDFQQVSIKMAKEQNLSLNPTKISGTCGRLMCCLRYENDVYVEAAKHCPRADSCVMTPQGKGTVVEANILCGKCKVKLDSDPENIIPFSAEELKILPKQKKPQNPPKEKGEKAEKAKENQ